MHDKKMHEMHESHKKSHAKKMHHSPQYDDMKVSKKMGSLGVDQGDMSPLVEDYQKPRSDFSQEGFNKTLEYVDRQDAFQGREAKGIEKQAYKGRYS